MATETTQKAQIHLFKHPSSKTDKMELQVKPDETVKKY